MHKNLGAAIQAAPTIRVRPLRGAFADGASNTAACMGGYKIRPYGPAFSFLVGADAHIGPPAPGSGAVRRTARTSIHTVGADYISARNRVH